MRRSASVSEPTSIHKTALRSETQISWEANESSCCTTRQTAQFRLTLTAVSASLLTHSHEAPSHHHCDTETRDQGPHQTGRGSRGVELGGGGPGAPILLEAIVSEIITAACVLRFHG